MAYFSQFPKISYDITGNNVVKVVPDILRRIKIKSAIKDNLSMFDKYDVSSGETPEEVSYKVYGSTDYFYVILLVNEITDRYYGWPLSDQAFEEYVKNKYANPGAIHHYEKVQSSGPLTGSGPEDYDHLIEVNSTDPDAESVSNYEYERRLQDQKRQIKILDPAFLQSFLNEFKKLIRR
jgi:hypothetical protein